MLPAWSPFRVQVPAETSVIVVPFTPPAVHTAGVVEVIVTGSPDVEVAVIETEEVASVWVPGETIETVWCTNVTVKLSIFVAAWA